MPQYTQQRRRRSVAAWADTWRIEMKCAFPGHDSYALLFLFSIGAVPLYIKQPERQLVDFV